MSILQLVIMIAGSVGGTWGYLLAVLEIIAFLVCICWQRKTAFQMHRSITIWKPLLSQRLFK